MERVLIDAGELEQRLASDEPPTVLDVRWQLGGPDGHEEYLKGHIPGAVFVDMEGELSRDAKPTEGRHPLPSLGAFQAAARRWGVRADRGVVVYDATGGMAAARAWWLLRWAGVDDTRLLDGGLHAWNGELATDEVRPEPSEVVLTGGGMPTVELEDVEAYGGVLLDARAGERYRGETEPIDPKAGHIPGAVSAPTTENLGEDRRFRPADELRQRFERLGATGDVVVYCGSGVTAAHEIAALAIAGIHAALYPGSWSQWSNHDLPVET